jgi:hypothetical protein
MAFWIVLEGCFAMVIGIGLGSMHACNVFLEFQHEKSKLEITSSRPCNICKFVGGVSHYVHFRYELQTIIPDCLLYYIPTRNRSIISHSQERQQPETNAIISA